MSMQAHRFWNIFEIRTLLSLLRYHFLLEQIYDILKWNRDGLNNGKNIADPVILSHFQLGGDELRPRGLVRWIKWVYYENWTISSIQEKNSSGAHRFSGILVTKSINNTIFKISNRKAWISNHIEHTVRPRTLVATFIIVVNKTSWTFNSTQ